jgi:hypothetical protein
MNLPPRVPSGPEAQRPPPDGIVSPTRQNTG